MFCGFCFSLGWGLSNVQDLVNTRPQVLNLPESNSFLKGTEALLPQYMLRYLGRPQGNRGEGLLENNCKFRGGGRGGSESY